MEGSAELGQQLFCFLISGGSGADADIHTTDLVHLVVLDFGEDQLLLQTEGIVAAAVKGVGVDTTEVTNAGQSHAEQTIQELIHLLAAQGNLNADGFAFTQLEVSNGLASLADHSLLAGDDAQILYDSFQLLGVVLALTAADIDDNLVQLGVHTLPLRTAAVRRAPYSVVAITLSSQSAP